MSFTRLPKKFHLAIFLSGLLLPASCSKDQPTSTPATTSSPQSPPASAPAPPVSRPLILPATLRADEWVDLYAKSSGYVASLSVDIGSRVHKGDVLLTIS